MEINKTPMVMDKKKPLVLEGVVIFYDEKNLNNHSYSKECVANMIEEYQKKIDDNASYGQIGYPSESDFDSINLTKISHKVTSLKLDEETRSVKGTIEVLNTPEGEKLKHLCEVSKRLDEKLGLTIRSRGTGTINKEGGVEDFNLISCDIVRSDTDAYRDFEDAELKIKEE
jgi:hypothetical protein